MKIVAILYHGLETYGLISGDHVFTKGTIEEVMKKSLPPTVDRFIEDGDLVTTVKDNIASLEERSSESAVPLSAARILPPISNPPKIVCLGLNYVDHAEEQGATPSEEPRIFIKPRTTIRGPYDDVIRPSWVQQLDYECELAVVIGRRGKNIEAQKALEHVLGYMILHDVSARDIQYKDKQWTRGKSFDSFAPTGPWITTADDVPDPHDLAVKTLVNGELRQNSSTQKMFIKIPQVIEFLSKVMTLEPGDIIATGTPAGVGVWMKPTPKFLREGDVVEMSISSLGSLKNKIVSDA